MSNPIVYTEMTRTIPTHESLTVEFKSDRARLSDRELIETVVCFSNTEGGEIYLGVEDNGQITGLHPQHQNLSTLAAMIANRTIPPISVRVSAIQEQNQTIARTNHAKTRYARLNTRTKSKLIQKS